MFCRDALAQKTPVLKGYPPRTIKPHMILSMCKDLDDSSGFDPLLVMFPVLYHNRSTSLQRRQFPGCSIVLLDHNAISVCKGDLALTS